MLYPFSGDRDYLNEWHKVPLAQARTLGCAGAFNVPEGENIMAGRDDLSSDGTDPD